MTRTIGDIFKNIFKKNLGGNKMETEEMEKKLNELEERVKRLETPKEEKKEE